MAIGTGLRAIKPFLIFKLCTGQFIFFKLKYGLTNYKDWDKAADKSRHVRNRYLDT